MKKLAAAAIAVTAVGFQSGALSAQDVLRVAVPSNLNTLDPAKTKIGEEYLVNYLVFDGLTEINRDMELDRGLAESWSHSEDLQTWTFNLRPGIRFHDGSALDAQDVIATVEHVLDKATGSSSRVNFLMVDRMEAVDDHTVRFELNTPYSGFPEVFGERHVRILPSEKIESQATDPIGTGPFRFESFAPGDRVELVRNDEYWKEGQPKLDGVVFQIMPETAARMTALQSGQVDVVWDLPLESIEEARNAEGIAVDAVATSSWDGIIMRADQPPFDKVEVRQAVAHAISKPDLVEIALFGNGSPTHSPISPASPYYNQDLAVPEPDPAKAQELLAVAGYPDGFEITLYIPDGRPNRERVGVAAQQMLRPIGINVDLQRVPWDQFINEIEGQASFYVDGFYSRPTVDTSVYPWYHSEGSWNDRLWHYANPEMDEILDAARRTGDQAQRAELYKKFQELAVQDAPGIIPYVLQHANAYRENVKGLRSTPMMWLPLAEVSLE